MTQQSDWIEWNGGECPVSFDTLVHIRVKGADGVIRERKGEDTAYWFDSLDWWQGSKGGNIIAAYLVVKP